MRKIIYRSIFRLFLFAVLVFAGCSQRAEILTKGHEGRRVGEYDSDGEHIAYVWRPAQLISTQGHLVVLDTISGSEVELEPDLNGPMAMCQGHVVWWNARLRDDDGNSDVILHDIREGRSTAIAHARVQSLDGDGNYVVWEESYPGGGSDIVLYDIETAQKRVISSGGREGDMIHRDPCVGGGMVAWETYNRKTRESTIAIFDPATGKLSSIAVPHERPNVSISGYRLVYCLRKGNLREIHLHDTSAGSDQVIASVERLRGRPCIQGDKIAWCEHVRKEEFKGIPGQPLMDEKDICDVFVCDLNSGKKRTVAEYLLSSGRVAIHGGRVYLNVYREYPPPGASNLVVPVDLLVW